MLGTVQDTVPGLALLLCCPYSLFSVGIKVPLCIAFSALAPLSVLKSFLNLKVNAGSLAESLRSTELGDLSAIDCTMC